FVSIYLDFYRYPRALHSFPTRRSSDLADPVAGDGEVLGEAVQAHDRAVPPRVGEERVRRLLGVAERPVGLVEHQRDVVPRRHLGDRKSTRLNSSHVKISYAVFCLKKKK